MKPPPCRLPLILLTTATLPLLSGCKGLPTGYKEERSIVKDAQGEWVIETRRRPYQQSSHRDEDSLDVESMHKLTKQPFDKDKLFSQPGPEDWDRD